MFGGRETKGLVDMVRFYIVYFIFSRKPLLSNKLLNMFST